MVHDEDFFIGNIGFRILQTQQCIQMNIIPVGEVVCIQKAIEVRSQVLPHSSILFFQLANTIGYFSFTSIIGYSIDIILWISFFFNCLNQVVAKLAKSKKQQLELFNDYISGIHILFILIIHRYRIYSGGIYNEKK